MGFRERLKAKELRRKQTYRRIQKQMLANEWYWLRRVAYRNALTGKSFWISTFAETASINALERLAKKRLVKKTRYGYLLTKDGYDSLQAELRNERSTKWTG